MPWYGNTARSCTTPSPTVYAPPRGSTIGSHSTVAPAPDAASTPPPWYACEQRVEQRRALEHRAQVQRRAVGEVDELARRARPSAISAVLGLGPVQHRQRARPSRPSSPKYAVGPLARPARGARTRPRSGSTTTSSAPLRGQQLGVELARAGPPLAAADQRERTGGTAGTHGGGALLRRGPPGPSGRGEVTAR